MTARRIDVPRPGFYRLRLVKGGPWVPALIYWPCPWVPTELDVDPSEWCQPYDRSRPLCALVNGKESDVFKVWLGGYPIPRAEYLYMIDAAEWDRAHAPEAPAANPTKKVDLNTMPAILPPA